MSLLAIGNLYTRVNIWKLSQEMVNAKKKRKKPSKSIIMLLLSTTKQIINIYFMKR